MEKPSYDDNKLENYLDNGQYLDKEGSGIMHMF